jgi:hypothetical protein
MGGEESLEEFRQLLFLIWRFLLWLVALANSIAARQLCPSSALCRKPIKEVGPLNGRKCAIREKTILFISFVSAGCCLVIITL